ncbi:hypothetical protein ACN28C_33395 [Plantactinospora sp. WMMC1484]|uniref:hypothetical protein n=1 Tax=Plantactinospora sp. WMMC1484 TaxID=3404122 RepID=UPI003BF56387
MRGLRCGVPVPPREYRYATASTVRLWCVVAQVLAVICGFDIGVVVASVLLAAAVTAPHMTSAFLKH